MIRCVRKCRSLAEWREAARTEPAELTERRQAFHERLADWDEGDVDRFATYLRRYNAAQERLD